MPYSTDLDLTKIRPKIMDYAVSKWDDQRTEAEEIIHRSLEVRWYREEAEHLGVDWRSYQFNPSLMLNGTAQLKRLSCYKTLELAFLHLMKDSPEPDAYERQMDLFSKRYGEELRAVLADGIDYDWDESGDLGMLEKSRPERRRTKRC